MIRTLLAAAWLTACGPDPSPPAAPPDPMPWGACGADDAACDPGYVCLTMEPGLGICVAESPCPSFGLGLPVADGGAWCTIPCTNDTECAPTQGLLCGEPGACGWKRVQ